MIVVDSSAVVAMMLGETGAANLAARLAGEPAGSRLMSVANYVEAGTVLAGRNRNPAQGVADLDAFLADFEITLAPVDERIARTAMQARIRFGKGFGAAAGLNFGDCFAYALAKLLGAPLLYAGEDFRATDVASAV
ncbi:MAG: type II toxin-antitoxin system VapC family toxin [Micropepsaceae bacterium]